MSEREASLRAGAEDTGRPLHEHFQRQERIRADVRLAELKRVYHEEQFLVDQLEELRRLTEEKHARDLAAFEEAELEKRLAVENAERQRMAAEDVARRQAAEVRMQQQFTAFGQTPMGKVLQAGFDIIGERRERAQIEDILGNIPTPFKFLENFVEDIRARVLGGVTAGRDPRALRAGFIETSALAGAGRGVPGGMLDPEAAQRRQDEKKRTSYAERTAVATEKSAEKDRGVGP
jgi:hypothetical protein